MDAAHSLNPDCWHPQDADCPYEAFFCWTGQDMDTADGGSPLFRKHRCERCEAFLERRRDRKRQEQREAGKGPGGAGLSKTTREFVRQARQAHPDEGYDYSRAEYVTNEVKVQILCRVHGPFWQAPNNHLRGRGCPKCKSSKGEKAVRRALCEAGIEFVEQWTDHDCRASNRLRFDFMLPRSRVLIEFDGQYHRQLVQWPGQTRQQAEAQLRRIQARDQIKDQWARKNGWTMVRIQKASQVAGAVASLRRHPVGAPVAQ